MSEFRIPPISTLIGSGPVNFFQVLRKGGRIDSRYYLKFFLTTIIVVIQTPFHWWESVRFKKRLKKFKVVKDPVFILGHWRSGTTFLHNMLCADPKAAYVSTYQSVFPNNLASQLIFKTFMKMNLPEKRPSDNVKLGIDLPQEDEFALSNMIRNSFYHFFYFPEKYREYYTDAVTRVNDEQVAGWESSYRELVMKAIMSSGGERIVLKNPVNTGRIKTILRIFPNAKFIFIYRNPVIVFLSTQKFFLELLPTLWFHETSPEFIENMIFDNFRMLMNDYDTQKNLIPKQNLVEVKFEDFEKNPITECRRIYNSLTGDDFDQALPFLAAFLKDQKGYTRNRYKIKESLLKRIESEWGRHMNQWGYRIPEELVVE